MTADQYSWGDTVCEWIEDYCVFPSGEWIGQPFRLLPWQRKYIEDLFTTDEHGTLRYRWSLLGIPKKNGKSTLIAALALYHLLGDPDEPDPWVVVSAASDKQADIVFDAVRRMCEMSPRLSNETLRYRWEIRPKDGKGKIERVAASAGKLDGKNISMLIVDELHEWLPETWTVLTNGTVGRRRAQIVQITTAGWDRESVCYREYLKGQAINSGAVENPTYLFTWYSAPEGADYQDEAAWAIANPSLGELVTIEALRDKAANTPQSQFERYFLNRWVDSEDFWLPHGAWEACEDRTLELAPGMPTWVGWDASTKNDSTAIAAVQNQDGVAVVRAWVWSRPVRPDGNPDETWRLPIAECEELVRSLCTQYDVQEVSYDPAWITWSASDLEAEGWPMVEFPQTPSRMCPATAAMYTAIVQGNLRHDGDPVLASHVKAARVRPMRMGGEMLEKIHKGKKIDAAVALSMAIHGALGAEAPPGPSVYETRGVLTL